MSIERKSDRWISLSQSVLLHGLVVGALACGFYAYKHKPKPPAPTLAVEASVVEQKSAAPAPAAKAPEPPPAGAGTRAAAGGCRPARADAGRDPAARGAKQEEQQKQEQQKREEQERVALEQKQAEEKAARRKRKRARKRSASARRRRQQAEEKRVGGRQTQGGGGSARRPSKAREQADRDAELRRTLEAEERADQLRSSGAVSNLGQRRLRPSDACLDPAAHRARRHRLRGARHADDGWRGHGRECGPVQRRRGGARVDRGCGVSCVPAASGTGSGGIRPGTWCSTSSQRTDRRTCNE